MTCVSTHPISSLKDADHLVSGTGEHIYPMTSPESNKLNGHSVAIVEIEIGKSTTMHHHPSPYEETYTIIAGIGKIILDGTTYEVKADDVIVINTGVKHKLINTGSEKIKFIVVCSPPWNPDCSITDEK